MKKNLASKAIYTGIGVLMGILLVTNFSPSWISSLFADEKPTIGSKNAPVVMSQAVQAINDAYVLASQAVIPTVVSISVEGETVKGQQGSKEDENSPFGEFFHFFQQPEQDRKMRGSGSGVIISENGYIVTNNHVIENASKEGIKVTLDNKKDYQAKLIGRDPLTDLAVIKIEAEGLPAVHFGDINKVRVGEMVLAVGNPMGLNSTVTNGIVSAIGRGDIGGRRNSYSVENYIQTDAAINPGNSGGGLFDLTGSLIGINAAIATSTGSFVGYGFAIPIDLVKAVVEDLIDNGKISRGYIGVQIKTIDEVFAKKLGLEKVEGVVVHDVIKGSPAQKAGLEPMDVILNIDGTPVKTSNELQSKITLHKVGDKLNLAIWRDKKMIKKTVTLEAKEKDENAAVAGGDEQDEQEESGDVKSPVKFDKLGFSVVPIDKKVKDDLEVDHGVLINNVQRYGVAADRGLFTGGVITKVDSEEIKSTKQLEKLLGSKSKGDVVLIQVKYKDRNQFVALEIPS